MKKWIAVLSVLLVLCTLLSACTQPQTPVHTATTAAETDPVTQPPEEPRTLKIGGVDISRFEIIYGVNAKKKEMSEAGRTMMKEYWKTEFDAELQTANRLAAIIKTNFGVELSVAADNEVRTPGQYEILIGATNRTESTEAATAKTLALDDYEIKLYGEKLVIRGGATGSMWHSLDALETAFAKKVENNAYTLTADAPITGSYHLTRIATIGDSITDGYNSTNRKVFSYVPTVARMYWQESVVYNYGLTSTTMRSDLADSYQKSQQWKDLLANTEKYDVVLIMLGTNDSNRVWKNAGKPANSDGNWDADDNAAYKSSAREIIDRVKQHSPNTKFVIMNCPAYYKTSYFGTAKVRELQKQIVTELKAENYDIHLFDMHSYTSVNLGSSMFPDGLHPDDKGHYNMAIGVTAMLKLLKEGKTDRYLLN